MQMANQMSIARGWPGFGGTGRPWRCQFGERFSRKAEIPSWASPTEGILDHDAGRSLIGRGLVEPEKLVERALAEASTCGLKARSESASDWTAASSSAIGNHAVDQAELDGPGGPRSARPSAASRAQLEAGSPGPAESWAWCRRGRS